MHYLVTHSFGGDCCDICMCVCSAHECMKPSEGKKGGARGGKAEIKGANCRCKKVNGDKIR